MKLLSVDQIMKLKVGDMVAYKERSGELAHFLYRAKVIGIYPRFILLSCAATRNPLKDYNDCDRFFNTCYSYADAHISFPGAVLFDYNSISDDFYNFGEL